LDLLHSLSTDSARYRARKDRKEQRATFRDIIESIESPSHPPQLNITINKVKHTIEGWREVKQFTAIKAVVSQGIGVHLRDNSTLQSLMSWSDQHSSVEADSEVMGGLDDRGRKALQRAQSKSKAKEMYQHHNKQRQKKMAHVMGED